MLKLCFKGFDTHWLDMLYYWHISWNTFPLSVGIFRIKMCIFLSRAQLLYVQGLRWVLTPLEATGPNRVSSTHSAKVQRCHLTAKNNSIIQIHFQPWAIEERRVFQSLACQIVAHQLFTLAWQRGVCWRLSWVHRESYIVTVCAPGRLNLADVFTQVRLASDVLLSSYWLCRGPFQAISKQISISQCQLWIIPSPISTFATELVYRAQGFLQRYWTVSTVNTA